MSLDILWIRIRFQGVSDSFPYDLDLISIRLIFGKLMHWIWGFQGFAMAFKGCVTFGIGFSVSRVLLWFFKKLNSIRFGFSRILFL